MDTTKEYLSHHKKIFSLKNKIKKKHKKPQKLVGWSLLRLIKHHFKSMIRTIIYFPISLFQGREYLKKTWLIKSSYKNKKALVIGNGPSQGILSVKELDNFVKSGGETFCVNYWNQNKKLSNHIPTWMVFSDSTTFDIKNSKGVDLINYLNKNQRIKIIIPAHYVELIKKTGLKNELYCFIDVELSVWKNINPLLPRGYLSMTLYKALAWAVFLNYKIIGVIGMDNTYAKSIYNNDKNLLQRLDVLSGASQCLIDLSQYYSNVASNLDDVVRLFYHLEYFPQKNIVNLDSYSLTDRFKKLDKKKFFRKY